MRFTNLAGLDTVYKYISLQSFTPCGREPLTHKLGYMRLQGETTEWDTVIVGVHLLEIRKDFTFLSKTIIR